MSAISLTRKLVAILAADAVGYSKLMAADEEGTAKLLAGHRQVIDRIIELHEGRIVNTAGDSVLAEFSSPVQAVRCAVEIQDALRTRNDAIAEDKRLLFRIGVNLGDVMVKGDDLLGDGVNVAARIESIADPGSIYISSSVYDQIAGKLDLGFVDVGSKSLKNIDRPVRVYRVDRHGNRKGAGRHPMSAGWLVALGAVTLLVLAVWHFALSPIHEAAQRAEAEAAAKAALGEQMRRQALERERAQAEKLRTEAEAAAKKSATEKQRADAEAAKRLAESEKLRAAAEAAKRLAEARAAEAAEMKRALEDQRAAEARTRAEADVARLRAEAEEVKKNAESELAAAAKARAKAEQRASRMGLTPTSVSTLREGRWTAVISCPPFQSFPARTITTPVSVTDDLIALDEGAPGQPLSVNLRGVFNSDGMLLFRGTGVSGVRTGSKPYRSAFAVRLVGSRYEGSGRLGPRECDLVLSRSP